MSTTVAEDTDLHLPLYGTLLARKLVVPSSRTGYVAVEQFLFFDLMTRRLAEVPVDESWYLATYPDVKDAIASGAVRSAAHHYARFGYFEHRMPRPIVVDEAWYLRAHPDVKDAIDKGVYSSGQQHYETAGLREGRLPFPGFSLFERRA
jgi:hypothetical protein